MKARTSRDPLVRALVILVATLLCTLGTAPAPAMAEDKAEYHAKVGPPDPIPKDFDKNDGGYTIGIDSKGHYCYVEPIRDTNLCRAANPGRFPAASTSARARTGRERRTATRKARRSSSSRSSSSGRKPTRRTRNSKTIRS